MSENEEKSIEADGDEGEESPGRADAQTASQFGLMRYVHAIFFAGAIALAWLFIQIVDTTWTRLNLSIGWVPAPRDWLIFVIGGVAGFGVAIYMWRHPKVNRLAIEVVTELSKVTWPTRKELSASTVVVIVVSVVASIILGVFDLIWSNRSELVLKFNF